MLRQKKVAAAIMVLYILFLPLGAFLAYKFLGNTKMVYKSPAGSLVAKSESVAASTFQNQIGYQPMWILVQSTNASQSVVELEAFQAYCAMFNRTIYPGGEFFGDITFIEGYFFVPDVPKFRNALIGGPNNDSTVLNINVANRENFDAFATTLQNFNDAWLAAHNVSSFQFQYTGVDLISKDLETGIIGDLFVIDAISMPLAFSALAYCVASLRLLLAPLLALPCTLTLAFSIMYPVSHVTDVSSFAPEMAAACMMAISIDYALFILSRFVEQVEMQHAKHGVSEETEWKVIRNTAILSAHNILISGLTIAVALGGLAFLPISFLSTIGMTMSCGAVCAVVVSLTLTPSVLYVFFPFFSDSQDFVKIRNLLCRPAPSELDHGASSEASFASDAARQGNSSYNTYLGESTPFLIDQRLTGNGFLPPTSPPRAPAQLKDGTPNSSVVSPNGRYSQQDTLGEYHLKQYREQSASIWFKVGLFAFRHPIITSFVICLIGAPFFYFAAQLRVDFDLFNQVPRNSEHAAVLKQIVAEIGQGSAAPYYLIFVGNSKNETVWTDPRFYQIINSVTAEVAALTGQPLGKILSPFLVPNGTGDATQYINNVESFGLYMVSAEYRFLFERTVSQSRTAALLSLYTTFDPFDYHADAYLNHLRSVVDRHQAAAGDWLFMGLLGASADSWTIMNHAMDLFPYQIVITFGVIFIFIAVVFRSVFVPFRMVFTVAYTIGISYGAGVLMFQYQWLDAVWPALDGVNAYTWTVPIFSFSLLSALALDYDVFLLTRILEFKEMGYSDEAAISKAVWKTGRIISFAGVIMFIAFGSLVFSNTTMLNQFGAIAALAVFVDTFLIRPFFAPALMSIFPRVAWWPRKFRYRLERSIDDMRGDLENHHITEVTAAVVGHSLSRYSTSA